MGQYHTIDLELNRKFVITKDEWDVVAIERIGKFIFWFDTPVLKILMLSSILAFEILLS